MNKLIIVSADFCKPCKALKERLKEKGYKFEAVDAEENDDFCTKHKIRNVPTTMVMKDGVVQWRATGNLNEQQFEVMDKALNE